MLTVRHFRRRHPQRRLYRTCLLGIRLLRRHHLTLVTAGIFGAALILGLTSTSFEGSQPAPSAANVESTALPGQQPRAPSFTLEPTPAPYLVIYYVVDSAERQREIEMALQSAATAELAHQPAMPTYHEVIVIRSPAEAAEAFEYLEEFAALSRNGGFSFRTVDLR